MEDARIPVDRFFASEVTSAFSFLVSDYDFNGPLVRGPERREPPLMGDDFEQVRFESDSVFVSIWRCPSRLEWDVEIGLRGSDFHSEIGFSVYGDLSPVEAAGSTVTPMWPDRLLPKALAERAELLKRIGGRALAGDARYFQALSERRAARTRDYWHREHVADAVRQAANAFKENDWARVVSLLAPIRLELSPAQLKQLKYAEKQSRLA